LDALFEDLFHRVNRIGDFILAKVNVSPLANPEQSAYFEFAVDVVLFGMGTHWHRIKADLVMNLLLLFFELSVC